MRDPFGPTASKGSIMIRSALLAFFFVISLFAVSCGENLLNTALDPSGTYQMTVEYTDYEMSCTLTLVKNESGFLTAVWDYGDEDGSTYMNTAVCFGENYLAICETGDPPILDILTIGDGALNGYWVDYAYDKLLQIHGTTEEGNDLPEPPELMTFNNPGAYSINGDNPDGSTYIGYLHFEAFGKVLSCDQTITPVGEPNSNYFGVAVVIDDYLVMAVSSFLSVYTSSGNDWRGVLVDYSEDAVTNENLTYTGS